jgi:hypothetical protein
VRFSTSSTSNSTGASNGGAPPLVTSTNGIKAKDATYLAMEQQIQALTAQRDALVVQIKAVLNGGSQGHQEQLIRQGQQLLATAAQMAGE